MYEVSQTCLIRVILKNYNHSEYDFIKLVDRRTLNMMILMMMSLQADAAFATANEGNARSPDVDQGICAAIEKEDTAFVVNDAVFSKEHSVSFSWRQLDS